MTIKNRLAKLANQMGVNKKAGIAIIWDIGDKEDQCVLYNGKRYSLQEWEQLNLDPDNTTFHIKYSNQKKASNE